VKHQFAQYYIGYTPINAPTNSYSKRHSNNAIHLLRPRKLTFG